LVEGNHAVDLEAYYEGDSLRFQVKMGDVTSKPGIIISVVRSEDFWIFAIILSPIGEKSGPLQYSLITQVNNVHEAGYDLNGKPDSPFFPNRFPIKVKPVLQILRSDDFKTGKSN
jgi:hypothetical protein